MATMGVALPTDAYDSDSDWRQIFASFEVWTLFSPVVGLCSSRRNIIIVRSFLGLILSSNPNAAENFTSAMKVSLSNILLMSA